MPGPKKWGITYHLLPRVIERLNKLSKILKDHK
jgi:hypothetical protein